MRLIPFALLLVLSACGFQPLYGTHQADSHLAAVELANLPNRDGQQLRLLLEDRFYGAQPQAAAQWKLDVKVTSSREDLGIRRDAVATRARRTFTASFSLVSAGQQTAVFSGSERSFVSYNIFNDPYATTAAEDDAQTRGLTQLADLIANRIALYLSGQQPAGANNAKAEQATTTQTTSQTR